MKEPPKFMFIHRFGILGTNAFFMRSNSTLHNISPDLFYKNRNLFKISQLVNQAMTHNFFFATVGHFNLSFVVWFAFSCLNNNKTVFLQHAMPSSTLEVNHYSIKTNHQNQHNNNYLRKSQ